MYKRSRIGVRAERRSGSQSTGREREKRVYIGKKARLARRGPPTRMKRLNFL